MDYHSTKFVLAGFLFVTSILQIVIAKSCHYNNHYAKPTWTMVKSPGYPTRFPAQTQCSWKITAPKEFRVHLEFIDFSLVSPIGKKCVSQWLNVIEGAENPLTGKPAMLTLCGNRRPKLIISSGNSLRLNLHSNSDAEGSTYRGFSAKYKYTQEDPFTPVGMDLLLPDNAYVGPPPANDAPGVGQSLGSVIEPHSKPRPLPPNPNAVLTLKNRRTESQNRVRNNGIDTDNANMNSDYPDFPRRPGPYGPQVPVRRTPTLLKNTEDQEIQELPPTRSKPLRQEIKILLGVLGAVAGIVLVLFLLKKILCDKAHKRKPGTGRVMHAYAHFRHFKKKKKKEKEGSKVNTISASIASVNGTLQSRDSGLFTSPDTPMDNRGDRQQKTEERYDDPRNGTNSEKNRARSEGRRHRTPVKEITEIRCHEEASVSSGRRTNRRGPEMYGSTKHRHPDRGDPPVATKEDSNSHEYDRERRKKRTRRRARGNDIIKYEMEARNRTQRRGHEPRSEPRQNRAIRTTSSDSADGGPPNRSWRDRAYS